MGLHYCDMRIYDQNYDESQISALYTLSQQRVRPAFRTEALMEAVYTFAY